MLVKLAKRTGNIRDSPLVQFIYFLSNSIVVNVSSSERDISNSIINSYNMLYLISFQQILSQKQAKRKYISRITISHPLRLVERGQKVYSMVNNSTSLERIWDLLKFTSRKYPPRIYDTFWSFTTLLHFKLSTSLKKFKVHTRLGF
jgi:hypothetical protein